MVLGVADDEFGVLIAQVSGVDGLDRRQHRRFGVGVVDVGGDHVVVSDRARKPNHRVVEIRTGRRTLDLGDHHGSPRR